MENRNKAKQDQFLADTYKGITKSTLKRRQKEGLYDPNHERDACGIGFIANIHNKKTHATVKQGLTILKNLDHRGATGTDPLTSDGAGILIQIPHPYFAAEFKEKESRRWPKAVISFATSRSLFIFLNTL